MKKRVFRPDSSRIITIKEAFERFQIKLIKADKTACGDIGGVSDIPRRRAVGGTLYLRTGNTLASDNGRKCNMDVSPKERHEQDVQFIETALKRLIEQVSGALPNRHMRLKNFVQFS